MRRRERERVRSSEREKKRESEKDRERDTLSEATEASRTVVTFVTWNRVSDLESVL